MSYHALPAGTLLDRNLVVRRVLGVGGFGITYLVHDQDLQQDLVLKEFFPPMWARRVGVQVVPNEDPESSTNFAHYLMRFLEEARVAARIRHPNLVRVHRFIEANGTGYFGMEWAAGETLEQLFKRENELRAEPFVFSPQAALELVEPLLDGLLQLHAAGLIHRDIKPANIYLRSTGGPLLLDFGAARAPGSDKRLTAILSPGYAPPEQYSEDGIQGPHTDVYALGAVLYRVLTGKEPLDAYTRSMGANASTRHISCVELAPPGVPPALCGVVDRAMALNIHERFADMSALRAALRLASTAMSLPVTGLQTTQVPQGPLALAAASAAPVETRAPTAAADPGSAKRKRGCAITITIAFSFAGAGLIVLPQLRDRTPAVESVAAMPTAAAPPMPVPAAIAEPAAAEPVFEPGEIMVASAEPVTASPPPVATPSVAAVPAAPLDLPTAIRAALPPAELRLEVLLAPRQAVYAEDEELEIGFSSAQDAYAAVFFHGQDGGVLLLYPDPTAIRRIPARTPTWIMSGAQRLRLRIAPPFGREQIHVLGFRQQGDLELLLAGLEIQPLGPSLWQVEPGSLRRSAASLRQRGMSDLSGWGEALQPVMTRPRSDGD